VIEFGDPYFDEQSDRLRGGAAFDAELERIEALLARSLKSQPGPSSLAERVFAASSRLLVGAPQPLRFQPALARPARSAIWGRLALAASVALAAMVGWPALTGSAMDNEFSDNVLTIALGGAADDADRFLDFAGLSSDVDEAATNDEAYMNTFGIMGTEVDDLLGEMSLIDSALGS
jgi:hypothetical protein